MERNQMDSHQLEVDQKIGRLRLSGGKTYFSRQGERRFYFFLTIIMLLAGIGYKIGLLF